MYRYIITIFILFLTVGCFDTKKVAKKVSINKEYHGWYIGTSNSNFFVVKRKGVLKKNLAFMLPEYLNRRRFTEGSDSFFRKFTGVNKILSKRYFLLGKNDSTSFGQNVSIFRAKAIFSGFDSVYINSSIEKGKKILYSIKASDGEFVIKALWIDCFSDIKSMILLSNISNDSIRYFNDDKVGNVSK